jgi:L,D-transpeptidase ErfK/SrfK
MKNEISNNTDLQDANSEVHDQNSQMETNNKKFSQSVWAKLLKGIILLAILFLSIFIIPFFLQRIIVPISNFKFGSVPQKDSEELSSSRIILEKSIKKLDTQLDEFVPTSCYMIINSTDNEFTLKKGNEIVRKGKCSTGSYLLLEDDKKQKKWLFKTPKGQLTVKSKKTDPIWTKPDWAFVEEGLPVPSPNHPSRFEEGVLGDYALTLGDGYMIHGTLWQRYLGLSVTHGCVRLNDADLEVVYKSLSKGSKVYIF